MKLFYLPRSRATRPRWLLEEIGIPYELMRLDRMPDFKAGGYQAIHPLRQVPALTDGDVTVFESSAICMYLADQFEFSPPPRTPARAEYYQWIAFGGSTFEPLILQAELNTRWLPEAERSVHALELARTKLADASHVIKARLQDREFIVGDTLSAADVILGSVVGWALTRRIVEDVTLTSYYRRLAERPAFLRSRTDD